MRIFSLGDPRDDEGTWTVLWHQIPEDRRLELTRLARRLRFLGFGSVQGSVWVSPHDHSAEVGRLLGRAARVGPRDLVHRSPGRGRRSAGAGLARLGSERARRALRGLRRPSFSGSVAGARSRRCPIARRSSTRTRLVHQFRGFPLIDPELPERLAPVAGPRARAASVFHELYAGSPTASQRHFEAVTDAYEAAS